jgi:putative oligomerization/nucleic acid binding protein/phospholipase D-like protein
VLAAGSYTFLDFLWDALVVFAWIIWFWLLITVFADLFRRHDTSGWAKAGWIVFVIVLPYIGVLVYLIAEHQGMADRNVQSAQAQQQQFDQYVQSVAAQGDPSEQIAKAKALLDNGTITQAEFDRIKQKALA